MGYCIEFWNVSAGVWERIDKMYDRVDYAMSTANRLTREGSGNTKFRVVNKTTGRVSYNAKVSTTEVYQAERIARLEKQLLQRSDELGEEVEKRYALITKLRSSGMVGFEEFLGTLWSEYKRYDEPEISE